MRVDLFDYCLPPERIALEPTCPREAARMLVVGADGALLDRRVGDFPDFLRPGDAVVVNDTRVIAARLDIRSSSRIIMPTTGLEPVRHNWLRILSPLRLPFRQAGLVMTGRRPGHQPVASRLPMSSARRIRFSDASGVRKALCADRVTLGNAANSCPGAIGSDANTSSAA